MDGAEASMGIYTIVEMAKLHSLDLYKYMKYILEQRPDYKFSDEELEKLAPWSSACQEICSNRKVCCIHSSCFYSYRWRNIM